MTEGGSHGDARATLGESMGIGHQVLKLTQQGDVVMRLGEAAVWGDGPDHFNGPSGVVVFANGDIWVSDGHRGGNNRIVKFASDGTFLLDVGGGANAEQIRNAFRILMADANVKAVLINIFGGILRCDVLAEGVIAAVKELDVTVPVVIRMEGTNVDEGKRMLAESGLNFTTADTMGEAASAVVALAGTSGR